MFEKNPSKRSLFSGRATAARGAALINSMRNLNIGGAIRSATTKKAEVNDWERQWDEDEDSDEEERASSSAAAAAGVMPQHALHHVRPGMDMGHSSVPHLATAGPPTTAQQQQLESVGSYPQSPQHQKQNAVVTPPTPDLLSSPLSPQEETLDWDHFGSQQVSPTEEMGAKPNVQMFLPMLRVLGKGSFGKVRVEQAFFVWRSVAIRVPYSMFHFIGRSGTKTIGKRERRTLCNENSSENASREAPAN